MQVTVRDKELTSAVKEWQHNRQELVTTRQRLAK
jgi:hypothetical protein